MAIPRNTQLFNHMAADLLVQLHEVFPAALDVDPRKLGARAAEEADSDATETWALVSGLASDTIDVMRRDGLIEVGIDGRGLTGGDLHDVRLTREGQRVLGMVPELYRERDGRPYAEQLKEALKNESPTLIAELVGWAFKSVIGK